MDGPVLTRGVPLFPAHIVARGGGDILQPIEGPGHLIRLHQGVGTMKFLPASIAPVMKAAASASFFSEIRMQPTAMAGTRVPSQPSSTVLLNMF
jgi:hypothetical protein